MPRLAGSASEKMEQRARRRKPGSAWREASLAEGVGVVGVGIGVGIGILAAGERPSSPAAIGAAIGVVAAIVVVVVVVAVAAMAA